MLLLRLHIFKKKKVVCLSFVKWSGKVPMSIIPWVALGPHPDSSDKLLCLQSRIAVKYRKAGAGLQVDG